MVHNRKMLKKNREFPLVVRGWTRWPFVGPGQSELEMLISRCCDKTFGKMSFVVIFAFTMSTNLQIKTKS